MKNKIILFSIAIIFLWVPLGCASFAKNSPLEAERPAVAPEQSAILGTSPTLNLAVRMAMERNPAIKAARLEWLAAIQREPQKATPEDPQIYQATYNFTENRWENAAIQVPTPWYRKLLVMGRAAGAEADIAQAQYEAKARDRLIDVKNSWYELYYLDRARAITEKIERLLRNDATLAYANLARGRTPLNEAFRAESQAGQLEYDRILLIEQRQSQAERFCALLNLPPGSVIGPVRAAPLYSPDASIEHLYARAEEYSSVLKIRGLEIERARYMTSLAKMARIPDPMAMLQIIDLGMPTKSSMGMATANLPIYEWKNRAAILEKESMEQAAREMARDEGNMTRAAVAHAFYRVKLSERLQDLYSNTLLPQAEGIMRQSEIDFQADQSSFSSVIETTIAYHNFMLAYHRAIADRGQALGELERILGTTAEPLAEPIAETANGDARP